MSISHVTIFSRNRNGESVTRKGITNEVFSPNLSEQENNVVVLRRQSCMHPRLYQYNINFCFITHVTNNSDYDIYVLSLKCILTHFG